MLYIVEIDRMSRITRDLISGRMDFSQPLSIIGFPIQKGVKLPHPVDDKVRLPIALSINRGPANKTRINPARMGSICAYLFTGSDVR